MNENYFDAAEHDNEQIPAYAMIPAGGSIVSDSSVVSDNNGDEDVQREEIESEEPLNSEPGAAEEIPAVIRPAAPENMLSGMRAKEVTAERHAEKIERSEKNSRNDKAEKTEKREDKENAVKLIPATDDLKSARIRLSGAWPVELPEMSIEEDILVPDTRPDLEKILSVTAIPEINKHESYAGQNGKNMLKINGSFDISVLYLPAGSGTGVVAIDTKIPFRREFEISEQLSPQAEIKVSGTAPEAKVINERKIRISVGAAFGAWEYGETEMELLEGVRDDSLLLKKERVRFTDMAQRRTDTTDIHEKIRIKESYPEPKSILRHEMNVVENHRQISKGKAVVEASLYYSILYMPEASAASSADPTTDEAVPVYVRGKVDFTQFLRLPDVKDDETAGSIVKFDILSSDISLRAPRASMQEDDDTDDEEYDEGRDSSADGSAPYFQLSASVAAGIQVYRSIERDVVTDMYHRSKDLEYSTAPYQISELCGSVSPDISIRETVNIPETRGNAASVPYISLTAENITASAEDDRCVIEGTLSANILFVEEETSEMSCFEHHIPFRAVADMPGACENSYTECDAGIKDVWFDRVNSRQIDINCSISARVSVWNTESHDFIDKVCYIDNGSTPQPLSGIVVYMTKPDDTQWSVSKKFRTTEAALREVNGLEDEQQLTPGMRLLIV